MPGSRPRTRRLRETAEDCLMWAALEGFPRRVTLLLERGRRPRRPGHPPPGPQGPHGAGGRPARRPHRRSPTPCARPERESRNSSARSAWRPPTWPPTPAITDPPPPGLIARAAAQGNAAAVALLLERGADVNAFGERATALHEAAWRNDTALVDLLLRAGADRTLRDRQFGAHALGLGRARRPCRA